MKTRILTILLLISALMCVNQAFAGETATDLLGRVAGKFKRSAGTQVSFRLTGSTGSLNGTLNCAGNKFSILTGKLNSWYDGKNMWSYNSSSEETTLVNPTASELAETNPMSFLNMASQFKVAYGTGAKNGQKELVLTPKSRKLGLKKVVLHVKTGTLTPTKIVVTQSSGQSFTVTVTKVVTGKRFAASTFTYPSAKYPGVKVVDLR